MIRFILGSESPRRKEIFGFFSIPFEQMSPGFCEESIPFTGNPQLYVSLLSEGKAEAISHRFPEAIIITADTIVYRDGKVYGKPKTHADAATYLTELNGEWHSVYTGVTVRQNTKQYSAVEETRVLFNRINEHQLNCYLTGMNLTDKAGAYAIQQAGGIIVRKIDGCYYNVMGMPINTLSQLLMHFNIDLWQHLKRGCENKF